MSPETIPKMGGVLAALALLTAPNALGVLSLDGPGVVGTMSNGEPAGAANEAIYVNHMLGLPADATEDGVLLPSSPSGKLHDFKTSSTDYDGTVSALDALLGTGTAVPAGFEYVIAKYGGPKGGDVVWFLDGAAITIPATSQGLWQNNQGKGYGLSGWTAFSSVPEASTLIAGALLLLPFAGSTLRVVRRRRV